MKSIFIAFLGSLLAFLVNACATQQNTDPSLNTSPSASQQNINSTNYQEMLGEQAARVQAIEAEVPHAGGRR